MQLSFLLPFLEASWYPQVNHNLASRQLNIYDQIAPSLASAAAQMPACLASISESDIIQAPACKLMAEANAAIQLECHYKANGDLAEQAKCHCEVEREFGQRNLGRLEGCVREWCGWGETARFMKVERALVELFLEQCAGMFLDFGTDSE